VSLDPHARKFCDMLATARPVDVSKLTPQQMRENFRRLAQAVDVKNEPICLVENGELPGPQEPLPFRIYKPQDSAADPLPALIYFHGGGCVFGSIDTHDGICRMLSNDSGCAIISIGYRQAPEHKFPVAVEDSYTATKWIVSHAQELGFDPHRVAVGGDSAGGGLAAVVCQLAALNVGPHLALQVLLCPVIDMSTESPSRRALAEGYFLDKATINWMLSHYCTPDVDLKDPRLSPLYANDLSNLPPAHIHTARFDPLCDEGEAYANLLKRGGIDVLYTCHEGMIHHFYGMAGVIPHARIAMKAVGTAIRNAFFLDAQSINSPQSNRSIERINAPR
jgi:acetyl esterase